MLNIIVCIKQVIDPEAPPSSFKIEPEAKRVTATQGTPPVLNPFDENALEAALKIKDKQPARITVLSMGQKLSVALLRTSLAVGADELVLLQDDIFDSFDAYFAAYVLAKAIKKMGSYDLILCGRQAADSDAGQVGVGLAEMWTSFIYNESTTTGSTDYAGCGRRQFATVDGAGHARTLGGPGLCGGNGLTSRCFAI